jgi:hypothetical protein
VTELLRRSTVVNTQRLLVKANECGFSGMLGSIDGMYWLCYNCPAGWQC